MFSLLKNCSFPFNGIEIWTACKRRFKFAYYSFLRVHMLIWSLFVQEKQSLANINLWEMYFERELLKRVSFW